MAMPQVTAERSGWRDRGIFEQHREWGWDVPMLDIDGIEFHNGKPVAIVEYKRQFPTLISMKRRYQAVRWMADKLELPYYVLFYSLRKQFYAVQPMNKHAAVFWGARVLMSERDYVSALYQMRGLAMPPEIGAARSMEEPNKLLWPKVEFDQPEGT